MHEEANQRREIKVKGRVHILFKQTRRKEEGRTNHETCFFQTKIRKEKKKNTNGEFGLVIIMKEIFWRF